MSAIIEQLDKVVKKHVLGDVEVSEPLASGAVNESPRSFGSIAPVHAWALTDGTVPALVDLMKLAEELKAKSVYMTPDCVLLQGTFEGRRCVLGITHSNDPVAHERVWGTVEHATPDSTDIYRLQEALKVIYRKDADTGR
jgi:hypothetical protein